MITIVVFLSVVIYFTEIIKYYIGIICFFKAAMKRRWVIIPFVLLDLTVALIHGFNESGVYMTPYLLAGVTAFFMMDKKMGVRICQVLGIFFITSGTDEIMGIILSYVLPVTWRNTAALSILEGILTICILFFIGKIKSRIKRGVSNSVNRSAIILAFCMLFCIILTITGLEAAKVYVPSHNLRLGFDIICIAAYLCMIGLVAFVFYIHEINKKLAISLNMEREIKKMQEDYYHVLLLRETETRRYRHDMNNHLLYLSRLCDNNDIEKVQKYVEELQEKLTGIQKKCYFTGNEVMDVLLNYHLKQLDNVKILVTGQFTQPLNISESDFCTVFSNLIQNAAEEVKRQEVGERYICIDIKQGKNFYGVELKNSTNHTFPEGRGLFHTRKPDRKNHGFGLINVKEIIEKYEGEFIIKSTGNEFTAIVTLNDL